MGRMRFRRSEEELREIAAEVQYEIDMMRHAVQLLERPRNRLHRTCYLELFLLHLRNIRDFLYPERAQDDDVLAEDLVAPKDWPSTRPPLGPTIGKERERLNRALAHISYSRLRYNKSGKGWKVGVMHTEIENSLEAFFAAVRAERIDWFKSNYPVSSLP